MRPTEFAVWWPDNPMSATRQISALTAKRAAACWADAAMRDGEIAPGETPPPEVLVQAEGGNPVRYRVTIDLVPRVEARLV